MTEKPKTPVLMSVDNPDGWKLEELAPQLWAEVKAKNGRLADSTTPEAAQIRAQNTNIMHYLEMIEAAQNKVLAELAKLGPDQGPRGTPRIGGWST